MTDSDGYEEDEVADKPEEFEEYITSELDELKTSSLLVNVEYLDLYDRFGEDRTWEILGKLKDLLG